MKQYQLTDIPSLVRNGTQWIDVRAPIEFSAGSVPGAVNLPLLNDEERHEVGIAYKKDGQQAAVDLGHRLVSGDKKEQRIQAWTTEISRHPEAVIYCFRGGLRSQTVQAWLKERGIERPIVAGGYKALRRYLVESIEREASALRFRVVSGPTGSGKTIFLRSSGKPFLDLESLARHRGSAFGGFVAPQPCQADFENLLATELIRLSGSEEVLVEDESRLIGLCHLPDAIAHAMQGSPVLQLEVPLEQRVENILQEYVAGASRDLPSTVLFERFRASIRAISRKLGGSRAQEVLADINAAEKEFSQSGSFELNRAWIRKLLVWYYDPLYQFSLDRRQSGKSISNS